MEELVFGAGTPDYSQPLGVGGVSQIIQRAEEDDEGFGFWDALGLLNRPVMALGEGVGAWRAGEDALEGALLGLSGGEKYGTLGTQLVPIEGDEDPGDKFLKSVAQMGIDFVADPLWLAAGPLLKLGGVGLKGAGWALGKAGAVIPQGVARYILPTTSVLKKFGGKWGTQVAGKLENAYVRQQVSAAQKDVAILEKLRALGIAGGKGAQARKAAGEFISSGGLRSGQAHPDKVVDEFARFMKEQLDEIGIDAERFIDMDGYMFEIAEPLLKGARQKIIKVARNQELMSNKLRGVRDEIYNAWKEGRPMVGISAKLLDKANKVYKAIDSNLGGMNLGSAGSVWDKEFYKHAWRRLDDYTPRMPTEDFLKEISAEKGFSKAVERLAKENNISRPEAEDILRALQYPRKAGNLEYARTLELPRDWVETDPLKYLPRYFEQVYGRIAFAEQFGVQGQKLNELLAKAVGGGAKYKKAGKVVRVKYGGDLDARYATELQKIALGHAPRDKSLERLAKTIMGAQVITKMGPLSTIMNLSQNANTFAREGGVSFTKGILKSFTDEGSRLGAVAYQKGIRDLLLNVVGGQAHWSQRYLKWVGFTPAERMNRLLGANAGVVTMERLVRQAAKKGTGVTEEMLRRGFTPDDLARTLGNGGKLPQDVADKVGFLASEATQHATHYKDIPLAWQSPGMKVAMQYKSFIYQQTRFLMREILKPAQDYFISNGKKGSLGPLLRATAAYGIGGQVVSHLRDQVRQATGYALGIEHEPKVPLWEVDDPVVQMLQDSLQVGALGLAGDIVESASRKNLAGWFLGPTWGDVITAAEGASDFTSRGLKDQEIPWERLYAQLIQRIPAASVLPRGKPMRTKLQDIIGM
jgi:hypothetical protein